MKKLMLALLAALACAALAAQGVWAADAKDDGPDMKKTLKWIKQYLNEEASISIQSDGDHRRDEKYVFAEKPWTSPEEATVNYENQHGFVAGSAVLVGSDHISFKLKDLDPDKIQVEKTQIVGHDDYVLHLVTVGGKKLISSIYESSAKDGKEVRALSPRLFGTIFAPCSCLLTSPSSWQEKARGRERCGA